MESVSVYLPTFFQHQSLFLSVPLGYFSSYFGGFTRKENHLKCFIEIPSQFLCVLPSLPTGLINLGET